MNTNLKQEYQDENGNVVYTLSTSLLGDGQTPVVQTIGSSNPVGFSDNGFPIMPTLDEDKLQTDQQAFMAKAIAVQKMLSEANGIDPSVVNTIGAENAKTDA